MTILQLFTNSEQLLYSPRNVEMFYINPISSKNSHSFRLVIDKLVIVCG